MDSNTNAQISDKQLLQLWDIHVGYETGTPASKKLPLCDEDKLNFARAVLQSASASRAELLEANTKLAGALDMVRETLQGGNVQDLLHIVNEALRLHRATKE
jgi:hypothetical protein